MNIIDSSSDGTYNYNESIDRAIYLRLQQVLIYPLGSLAIDNVNPIKDFIDTMNGIQAGTIVNNQANTFLGTLGITQFYPHRDNNFKGVLG